MAVDGEFCPHCDTGKPKTKALPRDPNWWRCCDVDPINGARCDKPGSLSDSTTGGGPWYCRQHYPGFRKLPKSAAPPPRGWQSLRDALRSRQPGEDDA